VKRPDPDVGRMEEAGREGKVKPSEADDIWAIEGQIIQ